MRTIVRALGVAGITATLASAVVAHELRHVIEPAETVTVGIEYQDGTPFAFVYYELFPGDSNKPTQVGRSDFKGRVFFAADETQHWRLKAFAPDGHGVDLRFDVPKVAAVTKPENIEPPPNRIDRLLLGLAMIFGGFGIYRFWPRKKS